MERDELFRATLPVMEWSRGTLSLGVFFVPGGVLSGPAFDLGPAVAFR
jgi:hypothetical protein